MGILNNFAVFEGIDGSGTTTQLEILKKKLQEKNAGLGGIKFFTTGEPSESPVGKLIRAALKKEFQLEPETLAKLFAVDRYEHLYSSQEENGKKMGIVNRCESGELVICDRFTLSSLAYQSIECGLNIPLRENKFFPMPEVLILFDIDPRTACDRIKNRPILELYENLPFQTEVRNRYLQLFESYKEMALALQKKGCVSNPLIYEKIDASACETEVAHSVWSIISKMPIFKGGS